MGEKTGIEWTGSTWTPIRARNRATGKVGWHCTHASEGCRHCYAETRNLWIGTGPPFKPAHEKDAEIFLDETMLLQPLRWRAPRMIFVCSMTDLFADFVPDAWIDRIFAVMALAPQHTFQVLTKRSKRMREYLRSFKRDGQGFLTRNGEDGFLSKAHLPPNRFPLPNVWLGVSAEDQARATERIPDLLAAPAAVRFVSAEPLLGPIDMTSIDPTGLQREMGASGWSAIWRNNALGRPCLDWVIAGGESGPHARPMHPDWARGLRDQCAAAGVPFFFKQWGEWRPAQVRPAGTPGRYAIASANLNSMAWPQTVTLTTVYPRQFDLFGGASVLELLGKRAAGRLLDGREHNDMPKAGA